VILSVIAVGRVLMYPDQHILFALTVGITLIGIVVTGCTMGSMLPIIMKRFGVDPATSSTPFIASITDTLGVIIYAHVAMVVMRHVIDAAIAHPTLPCP
jgi:magnesium transporter